MYLSATAAPTYKSTQSMELPPRKELLHCTSGLSEMEAKPEKESGVNAAYCEVIEECLPGWAYSYRVGNSSSLTAVGTNTTKKKCDL